MTWKKKTLWLFVLTGSLLLLLAGCGKNEGENAKAASPLEKNVLVEAKTDVDLSKVVLRVGAAEGRNAQSIIKAAGLDNTPYKVEFNVMQGGNLVMEALAANQMDLGTGSQIPPLFASQAANQGNFKIIATKKGPTLDQELLIGPDSSIKTVAELKGKKVAYVKNTTAQYFLAKMLTGGGISWKDIDAIPMSTSDGLSALLTGEVDAYAGYGNAIRSAHKKGAKTLQSAQQVLSGDFYWYATPDSIKDPAKHAAIADYLARFHEANEWARTHQDEWAKLYSGEINQKPEEFLSILKEENSQVHTRIVPVDAATIASEQDIANVFHGLGLLKEVDVHGIFDHSFDEIISKFTKY